MAGARAGDNSKLKTKSSKLIRHLTSFQLRPPCPDCLMMSQCLTGVSLAMRHIGRWTAWVEEFRKVFYRNELLWHLPNPHEPPKQARVYQGTTTSVSNTPYTEHRLDSKLFNFNGLIVVLAVCGLWHGLCSAKSEFSTGIIPAVDPAVSLSRPGSSLKVLWQEGGPAGESIENRHSSSSLSCERVHQDWEAPDQPEFKEER